MNKNPSTPSESLRSPRPRNFVPPTSQYEERRPVFAPPLRRNNSSNPGPIYHNSMPYPPMLESLREEYFEIPPIQPDMHEIYRAHEAQPHIPITLPFYPPVHPMQYSMVPASSYLPPEASSILMPDQLSYNNFQPCEYMSASNNDLPLNLARDVESDSSSEVYNQEDMCQNLQLQYLGRNFMGTVRESDDFGDLGRYLALTVDWARRNMQYENITSEERRVLLLNNWPELLVITLAQENYTFNEEKIISQFAGKLNKVGEDLSRITNFITRINLQKPKEEEFNFLKMIMLYRTEPPNLLPSIDRDALQDRAMLGLIRYKKYSLLKRGARLLVMLTTVCELAKCALLKHLIFKADGYDLNIVLTAWLLRPR